jgi:hypothetical protein
MGMKERIMNTVRTTPLYGAMIANQVRDHMKEGRGAPTEEDMKRFIEEALAICELEKMSF